MGLTIVVECNLVELSPARLPADVFLDDLGINSQMLKGGVTVFNIWTISPVGIGIGEKIF